MRKRTGRRSTPAGHSMKGRGVRTYYSIGWLFSSFEALAATYLWVFTIDAQQLLAAIDNFPQSAVRLWQIQKEMAIRRAVVRYAEEISWKNGKAFQRALRIYAKHIGRSIIMENGGGIANDGQYQRITKRRRGDGAYCCVHYCGDERRGRREDAKAFRNRRSEASPQRPKHRQKNQASSCSSIARAAAQNFGLHMREQDLKAALKDEKAQKAQMAQLYRASRTITE